MMKRYKHRLNILSIALSTPVLKFGVMPTRHHCKAFVHFQARNMKTNERQETVTKGKPHVKIPDSTKTGESESVTKLKQSNLGEILLFFLDIALDAQKEGCLPLVQLAELIERKQLVSEHVLVFGLNSLKQVHKKLVLAL